jgi:hypothetical protein
VSFLDKETMNIDRAGTMGPSIVGEKKYPLSTTVKTEYK